MAILRVKDILKMTTQDRKTKIDELQLELLKAHVAAHRTNAKTKEIKRAISRLLTINSQEELKKK